MRTRYATISVISPTDFFLFFWFSIEFGVLDIRPSVNTVLCTLCPLLSFRCSCTAFLISVRLELLICLNCVCVMLSLSFAWQVGIRYHRPDEMGRRLSVGFLSLLSSLDTSLTLQIHLYSDYQVSISITLSRADITIKMYTDDQHSMIHDIFYAIRYIPNWFGSFLI